MWPRVAVVTIGLLSSLCARAAAAQGSVAGLVSDTSAVPVAGAQIALRAPGKAFSALSDPHGAFSIEGVDEGVYGLAVHAAGFAPIANRQLAVVAGAVARVDIVLAHAAANGVATLGTVTVDGSNALSRASSRIVDVNPQALAAQGAAQLTDAIGQQLNATIVHQQGGAPGLPQTLALRGPDPQETIVDIDGHQVNNQNTGDFDLELLDPAEFAGVQIVYGVGPSTLVGASAEGGAINFRTIEPTLQSHGLARISYGSFESVGETIETTGTDQRIGYALLYRRFTTQGEVNDYPITIATPGPGAAAQTAIVGSNIDATTTLAKIRYTFEGNAGFIEASFRDTAAYRNLSAPLSSPDNPSDIAPYAPFTAVNAPGAAALTTAPAYGLDLQVPLGRKDAGGEAPATLTLSHLTNISDQSVENINPALNPYLLNMSDRVNDDVAHYERAIPGFADATLSFSADVRQETLDAPDALAPGPPLQHASSWWGAGRYAWSPSEYLHYTLALFYSWYSTFGTSLNPRVALVWTPLNTVVRASFGTGFQPPLLTNLVFNPGLLPERSVEYDLGAEHRFGSGPRAPSGTLNLYSTLVNNPTQQLLSASGAVVYIANIGQNRYEGLELLASQPLTSTMALNASYGIDSAYSTTDPALTNPAAPALIPGEQFMSVPLHKAQLGVQSHVARSGLGYGIAATYESSANELNRPAFVVLDADVGVTFGHTDVNVAGTNLTNAFDDKFTLVGAGVPYPIPGGTMPTNAYSLQAASVRVTLTQRF
ncbi:MAG: TonB-dependent receptor [Candidatus Eremiobacteraeota bacterium]|nr:TonB-dependent receptor [Candidatus Eremiobacteraeota bacterium]